MNAYDVDMYETVFGYLSATIFFTFAILLIPTIIILNPNNACRHEAFYHPIYKYILWWNVLQL